MHKFKNTKWIICGTGKDISELLDTVDGNKELVDILIWQFFIQSSIWGDFSKVIGEEAALSFMSGLIDKANHYSWKYNTPHAIPDLIQGFSLGILL